MSENEALHRTVNQHIDQLIPHDKAWASTVIIVVERGDKLGPLGTGTLFRIADESFLVTATHVIEKPMQERQRVRVAGSDGRFLPLRGECLLGEQDQSDVALVRISQEDAELVGRPFLHLGDVCFDFDLSNTIFSLFGFPEMWCVDENGTFKQKRFHYTTHAFEGEPLGLGKFDENLQFLLIADLSETTDIHGKPLDFTYRGGVSASFPSELKGISGCSVWKIADERTDLRLKTPDNARIVGVEIGVYPKPGYIKVTRWDVVRQIIYNAVPSLRGPLELWRGNA